MSDKRRPNDLGDSEARPAFVRSAAPSPERQRRCDAGVPDGDDASTGAEQNQRHEVCLDKLCRLTLKAPKVNEPSLNETNTCENKTSKFIPGTKP
ncbi:hypothetical protein AMS68_003934 [Peltaster fructicola]|uniref:Uncharacterized protein n=1 Tax=Peltaster fructicola TaxID=286661 RepID=A0A6H0XUI0_9PEZI|nr:hypothetical protein AMS68_003934 [Peltaster fructicola]